MAHPLKILHVEDNPRDAEIVSDMLAAEWPHCAITLVSSRETFTAALVRGGYDLVLSDFQLPGFNGLEALELTRAHAPDLPFIFFSGTIGEERAIEAVRAGAADYVIKDRMQRLPVSIQRVLRESNAARDRRRIEQALAQEQYLLQMLMEHLPDYVYFKDLDSRFISVSHSLARRNGLTPAEMKGKTDADLYQPEHARRMRADEEQIIRTGQPILGQEEQEIWLDGHRTWVSSTKLPLRDATGAIVGTFGISRDITDRRKKDEALRLFRTLVDRSDDAFEIIDPVSGRFLDVSDSGCLRLGYTREELLLKHVFEIDSSMSRAEWPQLVVRLRESGTFSVEGQHRRKDGSTFPVEISARLVTIDREYLVAVVRDVTEKKKLEEQFLRAQRLESLGMLATGISHDLNNILAPVLMGAPLLRLRASHPGDLRVLDTIENSASRGAGLVRQILSFAHGASGEKILVQAKHLLRDLSHFLEETLPKTVSLTLEVPNDLWTVRGNPTQLHQVLLNLCVNARDAMPAGGVLGLTAANRRIGLGATASAGQAVAAGAYLVIEVADNGTGIAPEILDNIWDPFFTTKGEGQGTGLGLATVRGIVAGHGGFIQVETQIGRGTTFRVLLPAAEPTPDETLAAGQTAPPQSRGRGELILVVDDEASIRELATAALNHFGYRVLAATNGTEAMALYVPRLQEIALVITDLSMPEMGGLELATALSRLNPDVRIIFISGAADGSNLTGLPPGCPVIAKPFNVDRLIACVNQTLGAPSAG